MTDYLVDKMIEALETAKQLIKARAEIERLRLEIAQLRDWNVRKGAEIERLREVTEIYHKGLTKLGDSKGT
jgi:hypothetical protein